MSELINNEPLPEEDIDIDSGPRSSWIMLITMLLLIAGFLLSTTLLMNQTLKARSADGEPIFNLSALAESSAAALKPAPRQKNVDTESESEEHGGHTPIDGFKNLVMGEPSDGGVRWPRLKLTGFGKSADGTESFAYLNGDLVHPGEFAGKVKLIEVREHDVVVEYKGELRNLRVALPE